MIEFFLDAAKNIRVKVDTDGERPSIDVLVREYSQPLNPEIVNNIKRNLLNIHRIAQHYDDIHMYDVIFGNERFAEFSEETGEIKQISKLTSYEVRRLGQAEYMNNDNTIGEDRFKRPVIFPREENSDFDIKTDVHSHLSAVLYGEDLVEIGIANDITFPVDTAKRLRLNIDGLSPDESGELILRDILKNDANNKNTLIDALEICPYTNETFGKMEEIYKARNPFTKKKEIVEDIMWKIAERYVENGIEYAELASTEVIRDLDFLLEMHKVLPKIEEHWKSKGKNIKIRFLAAIARNSITERKEDELDILKEFSKSPYIVGCDFLGHESNPTSHIGPQVAEMVKWAAVNDPDFTIRVHAGETDIFSNVEEALKVIKTAFDEAKAENKDAVLPPIRIGHAVYKVKNKEVDALVHELGAIFECNGTSNYSLNNASDYNSPLKKNLEKGIPTVIGTDGFGLYGTSPMEEKIITNGRGIQRKELSLVNETENGIIERSERRFERASDSLKKALERYLQLKQNGNIKNLFNVKYRNGEAQYEGVKKTKIDADRKAEREELNALLTNWFQIAGAKVITKENFGSFIKKVGGRTPVLIMNNSLIGDDKQLSPCPEELKEIIDFLVERLDPKKAFFVTGGVKCGAEKYLMDKLKDNKKKFDFLDFITQQSIMRFDTNVQKGVITDAVLINDYATNVLGSNFLLPKIVGDFLSKSKGAIVAMGGSSVEADIIQESFNRGNVSLFLGDYINGVARKKGRQFGSICSFRSKDEFVESIKGKLPDIFAEDRRGSSGVGRV